MLIEIYGGGFENKGAQLMLETVINRLAQSLPAVSFCVEKGRRVPPSELQRLQIKTILVQTPGRLPRCYPLFLQASDVLGRLVPRSLCQKHHAAARHDIDALIDVAGFGYGDACGARPTKFMAARAEYYARQRKPVVFLPQMFGTFQDTEIRPAMRRLCAAADLIYARDEISYRCVEELLSAPANKLRLAPDITIFAEPDSTTPIPEQPYACIVPNVRVLRQGAAEWRDRYVPELLQAIRFFRSHRLDVLLVEHETMGADRRLIEQLHADSAGDGVSVCDYASPFQLKAVLGGAQMIVASRYHAAVSGLSSGVPTIVLGWAHKYDMLMTDFGVRDCIHQAADGWPHLEGLLSSLLDEQGHRARQTVLREKKEAMREVNQRMWDDVIQLLANR